MNDRLAPSDDTAEYIPGQVFDDIESQMDNIGVCLRFGVEFGGRGVAVDPYIVLMKIIMLRGLYGDGIDWSKLSGGEWVELALRAWGPDAAQRPHQLASNEVSAFMREYSSHASTPAVSSVRLTGRWPGRPIRNVRPLASARRRRSPSRRRASTARTADDDLPDRPAALLGQLAVAALLMAAILFAELTPEQRRSRARVGAYAQQAKHDTKATTRNARAAFLARFEREVDPDGILTPAERSRRAEAAKKAYFQRLALKSSRRRGGS